MRVYPKGWEMSSQCSTGPVRWPVYSVNHLESSCRRPRWTPTFSVSPPPPSGSCSCISGFLPTFSACKLWSCPGVSLHTTSLFYLWPLPGDTLPCEDVARLSPGPQGPWDWGLGRATWPPLSGAVDGTAPESAVHVKIKLDPV